jgi:phage-related protein
MLVPAFTTLIHVGTDVTTWMVDSPDVVQALAIALGVLVLALVAVNVVMWALSVNPIVLIIAGIVVAIGALIAIVWLLAANWDQVIAWLTSLVAGMMTWLVGVLSGFLAWWNGLWTEVANFVITIWNDWIVAPIQGAVTWLWNAINGALLAIQAIWNGVWTAVANFVITIWNDWIVGPIQGAVTWMWNIINGALLSIQSIWGSIWSGLTGVVRDVWNGVLGFVEGGVNGAIDLINGLIGAVNSVAGVVGIQIGVLPYVSLPRLATGTVTNGPMVALIGDNPGGREVVSPLDTYQDELRRAYTAGRSSTPEPSGPTRLARQDLDYLVDRLGERLRVAIMTGAQKAVIDAL